MRTAALALALILWASTTHAVTIGFFPGLNELIEKADAIVILRVDQHLSTHGSPTLHSTCDCYVYQTLKGDIPAGQVIRVQLMDTRTEFVSPYATLSTHLVFLTKKRSADEPTSYRTLQYKGANVRLTPFGHEKMPEGETTEARIRSLMKRTLAYNQRQDEEERLFLEHLIEGTPEQTSSTRDTP